MFISGVETGGDYSSSEVEDERHLSPALSPAKTFLSTHWCTSIYNIIYTSACIVVHIIIIIINDPSLRTRKDLTHALVHQRNVVLP